MLNFLRKLRRNEMKGTKYLQYALGEILLVVIGILIALQINNANEARKQRIEETKLLRSIKVDFERSKATLQQLDGLREDGLYAYDKLVAIGNSGDFSNTILIDSLLAKTNFTPTYNGNTSSLSILVNSGKINLLRNDSLTALLLAWPSKLENLIERELDILSITNGEWVPFAQSYTSVNDWFKHYDFPGVPAKTRDSRVAKDYKGLFNDRRLENLITRLELLYIACKDRSAGLIKSADQIIHTIDEDLKSR
ncbi:DUF6090 family protein [Roseivirga sp. E12]|uniref:DUF6090 family protein n=1 Tax=Roseivirga sp. E12 TaxID=2819237 RepID=UPI001ABD3CFC|nr:DUF6090 family protein [Roseivirga sp. E12]MBO3700258.1 hypothetical protein [Roseivirga sp. E12]